MSQKFQIEQLEAPEADVDDVPRKFLRTQECAVRWAHEDLRRDLVEHDSWEGGTGLNMYSSEGLLLAVAAILRHDPLAATRETKRADSASTQSFLLTSPEIEKPALASTKTFPSKNCRTRCGQAAAQTGELLQLHHFQEYYQMSDKEVMDRRGFPSTYEELFIFRKDLDDNLLRWISYVEQNQLLIQLPTALLGFLDLQHLRDLRVPPSDDTIPPDFFQRDIPGRKTWH